MDDPIPIHIWAALIGLSGLLIKENREHEVGREMCWGVTRGDSGRGWGMNMIKIHCNMYEIFKEWRQIILMPHLFSEDLYVFSKFHVAISLTHPLTEWVVSVVFNMAKECEQWPCSPHLSHHLLVSETWGLVHTMTWVNFTCRNPHRNGSTLKWLQIVWLMSQILGHPSCLTCPLVYLQPDR